MLRLGFEKIVTKISRLYLGRVMPSCFIRARRVIPSRAVASVRSVGDSVRIAGKGES
jgi:hypothetical protein